MNKLFYAAEIGKRKATALNLAMVVLAVLFSFLLILGYWRSDEIYYITRSSLAVGVVSTRGSLSFVGQSYAESMRGLHLEDNRHPWLPQSMIGHSRGDYDFRLLGFGWLYATSDRVSVVIALPYWFLILLDGLAFGVLYKRGKVAQVV